MLKKTVVTLLFAVSVVTVTGVSMFAQDAQRTQSDEAAVKAVREDIRAHRKQITAENVTLTPDEATKFWPLYDQYIQETIKINDARWDLMKNYATNYDKMTDELATEYMKKSAEIDKQLVTLRQKYVPIFEKVVSVQKTARWYQVDRRLDQIINMQISSMIPMVNPSPAN